MKQKVTLALLVFALTASLAGAGFWGEPVSDQLNGPTFNGVRSGICVFKAPHNYIVVRYLDLDGNGQFSGRGSGEALSIRRVKALPLG